jgi:hypothetical protein
LQRYEKLLEMRIFCSFSYYRFVCKTIIKCFVLRVRQIILLAFTLILNRRVRRSEFKKMNIRNIAQIAYLCIKKIKTE